MSNSVEDNLRDDKGSPSKTGARKPKERALSSPQKLKSRSLSPKKQRKKSPVQTEGNIESPIKSKIKQKVKSVSELNLTETKTEQNITSPMKSKKMKNKSI